MSCQTAPNIPGSDADDFIIQESKAGNAQAMLTIPILGWVGKLGPGPHAACRVFSIAKIRGAQTGSDYWFPDAGQRHFGPTALNVITNDPTDANMIADTNFQSGWVRPSDESLGAR